MIIYNGYSDERFLDLSEFECKSDLEKELWRRLNEVYIGFNDTDSDYYGFTMEELVNKINEINQNNVLLEDDINDLNYACRNLSEELDECKEECKRLEEQLYNKTVMTNNIIHGYLKQILDENQTDNELVENIKNIQSLLFYNDYNGIIDSLQQLCYNNLNKRYSILSIIMCELEHYE